ncbi:hypothetical protein LOTGIDRAFT_169769 [Lottia gigantea]|uniref:MutL C-terminal dimerisation domain-containing protein n=1 Tax=Lottia gigantea TaxID=225164 RepID=V3ZFR6_LOTGI|nr:hypothetical protein LOTGIDRAFT_169769 [Lottia gigantea]ESO82947.1 hypothetical protein LOTGIDRAFT_169769 [Lottia gigantea]
MVVVSSNLSFSNSENILCSKKTSSNISTLCTNDTNNLYGMLLNHLDTNQEEQTIKWRNETNINSNTGNSIDDMFNQWQNPVHGKPNQCGINTEVSHSSRSAVTSYQSLNQITFTKDMLSCMQVLGQVDSKFIACLISSTTQSQNKVVVPDLLVMLDQHAAHERVRLEQYISEIFGEEVDGEVSDKVKQSEITPPLSLTLQQEDIRVMISFKHEFSRIGIKFTGVEENRNEIKLNSIPACIVEREANELKRGKNSIATQFVEELITEHVEYLKNTSGSRRRLPLALHRILATKACRGAIKFNDILSPAQCKELITALSKCDLPFQCAHGRPSIIPLFKLDSKLFQQTQVKPQLDKLRKGRPKQE